VKKGFAQVEEASNRRPLLPVREDRQWARIRFCKRAGMLSLVPLPVA